MKITQEIIDNGQKIVYVDYEKEDIEELTKLHAKELAKRKADLEKHQKDMAEPNAEEQLEG